MKKRIVEELKNYQYIGTKLNLKIRRRLVAIWLPFIRYLLDF